MKKNLKKLCAALLLTVLCVLPLAGCGKTTESVSFDEAQLQMTVQGMMTICQSLDEVTLDAYAAMDKEDMASLVEYNQLPFTPEAFQSGLKGYASSLEDLGDFVSFDGFDEVEVKGDEATVVANYTFSLHEAKLSMVFNKKAVVQSVAIDPVYTMGEILEKAGLNTLLGMGVVFAVLILISLIISCFRFIPAIEAKFAKKDEKKAAAPAPAAKPAAAPAPSAPVAAAEDDLALVAVITAAVAAAMSTSTDGFVVRSIRRKDTNKWKRS